MNFVPVFASGGIGDLIIAVPWLLRLIERLPPFFPLRLYTHWPDIGRIFLPKVDMRPYEQMQADNGQFTYWIHLSDMVSFNLRPNVTSRNMPEPVRVMHAVWSSKLGEWGPLIAAHPHAGLLTGKQAVSQDQYRWTLAHMLVGFPYKKFSFNVPDVPGKFITVHDGYDSTHQTDAKRSTKSWDMNHWAKFVTAFRDKHPDIDVIQVGGGKSRPIQGVTNLIGKTSFEQSLPYLKCAMVHVDGDSGLVHARRLFDKKSVVLFGPTDANYFGYPENINMRSVVCGNCWWLKEDWLFKCLLGNAEPLCMDSITPETVLEKTLTILGEK